MTTRTLPVIVVLALLAGCGRDVSADVTEDSHPMIAAGMSRQRVLDLIGPPTEKRTLVKTDTPGFGYPACWDSELNVGESAEQWIYQADEGSHEIYFLKGADTVGHTRFVPKGIIF